jgi:glycosyltransferase involved in cell wall biosynthesis
VKVVAVVLTHQAVTFDRLTMLSDTVQSLREADEVLIVDNGSTDGSAVRVEDLGGFAYRPADGVSTCGRGMNICMTALLLNGAMLSCFQTMTLCGVPGGARSWRRSGLAHLRTSRL